MIPAHVPATAEDAAAIVAEAAATSQTLEITGGGTKQGWGRPMEADARLDLSGLSGIIEYDPAELVMTAWAGTAMAEIEDALKEHGQILAFEPPDMTRFFGGAAGPDRATLGGVIACNLSGSRRIQAGAARDHILGFEGVNGAGGIFKSGGRVVKNVTGFDLSKLMAGSFGTLAVLTSVSVKVVPDQEKTRTLIISGLTAEEGMQVMASALGSPHDVNAAAYLPAELSRKSKVDFVSGLNASAVLLRLQGPEPSVRSRFASLSAMFRDRGPQAELHRHNSAAVWREIQTADPYFPSAGGGQLWRLSVAPAAAHGIARKIGRDLGGQVFFDWGGGLIWLHLPDADAGAAAKIRTAFRPGEGHATLMRADDALRRAVPVFQPEPAAVGGLARRLKTHFDPAGILNPGRMNAED